MYKKTFILEFNAHNSIHQSSLVAEQTLSDTDIIDCEVVLDPSPTLPSVRDVSHPPKLPRMPRGTFGSFGPSEDVHNGTEDFGQWQPAKKGGNRPATPNTCRYVHPMG